MKKLSITITKEELDAYYIKRYQRDAQYKTGVSGYADIIEDLGICAGVGGIYDEYWYTENIDQAEQYVHDHFNFEDAILALPDAQAYELLKLCKITANDDVFPMPDGVHTYTASIALNQPEYFAELLKATRELAREELYTLFPEYEKVLQEACDSASAEMEREFINGDYHGNFIGLCRTLEKEYDADDVRVDAKSNDVTFTWEDDAVAKDILADNGYKRDARLMKKYVISTLCESAHAYTEKEKREREARRIERERVAEYQKERDAKANAERLAKIDAIRL